MPHKKPEIRFNIDPDVHKIYRVLCSLEEVEMTEMSRRLIYKWIEEQESREYVDSIINDSLEDAEK